jgi:ubiquitin-like modifier-activating enzyme ATG7
MCLHVCHYTPTGLAPITSALAVELLAALLQHPAGVAAPALGSTLAVPPNAEGTAAYQATSTSEEEPALGGVPHMIRGQLNGFSQARYQGPWS